MQENRPQKEFFEFEKPKKPLFRLPRIFRRTDLDGNLKVSFGLEKLLFISIALIMVAVIIYALGVERGKSISKKYDIYAQPVVPVKISPPERESYTRIPPQTAGKPPVSVSAAADEAVAKIAAIDRGTGEISYAIVTATFRNKEGAEKLGIQLRKEGFDAHTVESGQYFQVCVGSFRNKNGAEVQKQLRRIRQKYKDAYIRML